MRGLTPIEKRLEKLERELARANRCNRWLLAGVVLAAGLLALAWTWTKTTATAQAQGAGATPKAIRVNEFILEDENGKPRAKLHMFNGGPNLTLFDEKGQPRVLLSADEVGPRLNLLDVNGKFRTSLQAGKDGPSLILSDENGKDRAVLGANRTERPDGTQNKHPESSLRLFGPDGKTIWSTF